jgi:hypothetical protein
MGGYLHSYTVQEAYVSLFWALCVDKTCCNQWFQNLHLLLIIKISTSHVQNTVM